jgi:hypothetical protein
MSFSKRMGITRPPEVFITESATEGFKNQYWNLILELFYENKNEKWIREFTTEVWGTFLKKRNDSLPIYYQMSASIRQALFEEGIQWFEWFNLGEFVYERTIRGNPTRELYYQTEINRILESENYGFRFNNGQFIQITNEAEIAVINELLDRTTGQKLKGINTHIRTAISLLSKKPLPDYRNSIKESISALEAAPKIITGESGGGLDKALAILDSKLHIHEALKKAIRSLYGYTSDEDGIRHAIIEEREIYFEDAKYILLSCTSLVNFIIEKSIRAKLI